MDDEQRRRQLEKEANDKEVKRLQVASGMISASQGERLDWMYEQASSLKTKEQKEDEMMNTSVKAEKDIDVDNIKKMTEGTVVGSMFLQSATSATTDMITKIREDPMFQIRKAELMKEQSIMNNPLLRDRLVRKDNAKETKRELKRAKKERKKAKRREKKKAKKKKKKRGGDTSSSSSSSSDSSDDEAAADGAAASSKLHRGLGSNHPSASSSHHQPWGEKGSGGWEKEAKNEWKQEYNHWKGGSWGSGGWESKEGGDDWNSGSWNRGGGWGEDWKKEQDDIRKRSRSKRRSGSGERKKWNDDNSAPSDRHRDGYRDKRQQREESDAKRLQGRGRGTAGMTAEEKAKRREEMMAAGKDHESKKDAREADFTRKEKDLEAKEAELRDKGDRSVFKKMNQSTYMSGDVSMTDRLQSNRHRRQKGIVDTLEKD